MTTKKSTATAAKPPVEKILPSPAADYEVPVEQRINPHQRGLGEHTPESPVG